MKQLLYIHGLGSGRDSRKYKLIEQSFRSTHHCTCAEWNSDTDIKLFLFNLFKRYLGIKELVIIGDSTGGNYACQLRDLLISNSVSVRLVLLNPLLNIANRIAYHPFPDTLRDSLAAIDQVDHCFLLQSLYDEVIDQTKVRLGERVVQLKVDDSHRLFSIGDYVPTIKAYIHDNEVFV
ncbi:YqiA/YcfP family alpha/beta fold hydrolase [Sphingobacterium sp. xlx-130]|uniref:YqiA/YcfP family alpha/beta fold hydrolase n=1 Tax=Sphingobacterium sp. xlx-130 TaxID=2654323 RepID=UPI0013DC8C69|nr:YqiA/YcfP family alpha/beta fold hydrolase [Sphingobacterium sp. xlx-130]